MYVFAADKKGTIMKNILKNKIVLLMMLAMAPVVHASFNEEKVDHVDHEKHLSDAVDALWAMGGPTHLFTGDEEDGSFLGLPVGGGSLKELFSMAFVSNPGFEKLEDSALHEAVLCGNFEQVEKLLNDSVEDINALGGNGTALEVALMSGGYAIACLLLSKGANPNSQDGLGWTTLHSAVHDNKKELVALLLRSNASANIKDNEGCTPLHVAVRDGNIPVAVELARNGADVTLQNNDGQSALDIAIEGGCQPMITLMKMTKSAVNVQKRIRGKNARRVT